MITAIVLAAIATAFTIVSYATPKGIENRESKKDYLKTLLYNPVYIQGLSFEAVKLEYLSDYRKNPKLFEQYYNEYYVLRTSDLANDVHPMTFKKNESLYQQYIALAIIVVLLLIINQIYK